MKFKNILPKWYSIVLWILIILFTQGCYTQLSMFYPEPEIEQEEEVDFFETYSVHAYRLCHLGFSEWIEHGKDFCAFCEETIRHQNYCSY